MSQEVESLLDQAVRLGLEARDLDDLVWDRKLDEAAVEMNHSSEGQAHEDILKEFEGQASAINNGSLEEQLPYLLTVMGVDELKEQLELLSAPGGPPEVVPAWEGGDTVFVCENDRDQVYGTRWAAQMSSSSEPERFQLDENRDVIRIYNSKTRQWEVCRALHVKVNGKLRTLFPLSPSDGFVWVWGEEGGGDE